MNYIFGKDRNQVRIECIEDYVDADSEVRVIDKIIDTLEIEYLGFKAGNNSAIGRPIMILEICSSYLFTDIIME